MQDLTLQQPLGQRHKNNFHFCPLMCSQGSDPTTTPWHVGHAYIIMSVRLDLGPIVVRMVRNVGHQAPADGRMRLLSTVVVTC